jgi:hypothetical protein
MDQLKTQINKLHFQNCLFLNMFQKIQHLIQNETGFSFHLLELESENFIHLNCHLHYLMGSRSQIHFSSKMQIIGDTTHNHHLFEQFYFKGDSIYFQI